MSSGSALARAAVARAEQLAGRQVDRRAVAVGAHSHDGGASGTNIRGEGYLLNCWELDAMDPNDLRDCVREAIVDLIEPMAWARCDAVNRAEQASLKGVLDGWRSASL